MKSIATIGLSLALLGCAPWTIHAQSTSSPSASLASAGVYSAAQASRGDKLYRAQCSSCHSDDLQGTGMTPPVSGDAFLSNWTGQPLVKLFDKIQASMPADHPGSLTRAQTSDILAFLLSSNNFPAGKTELPSDPDALKRILLDAAPAKN